MREENLPPNFRGYSTKELLELWESIPFRRHTDQDEPPGEMVLAMRGLLREYRLAPVEWRDYKGDATDMVRSKKLLKPYGIDPAPWADAEGNRQPELEAAWRKKLRRPGPNAST